MKQIEFDYDDLTPEQQTVYLKAAQRLLNEAPTDDDEPSACAACGHEPPSHASWCPIGAELPPL